jgi:hypothetical protein
MEVPGVDLGELNVACQAQIAIQRLRPDRFDYQNLG